MIIDNKAKAQYIKLSFALLSFLILLYAYMFSIITNLNNIRLENKYLAEIVNTQLQKTENKKEIIEHLSATNTMLRAKNKILSEAVEKRVNLLKPSQLSLIGKKLYEAESLVVASLDQLADLNTNL